MAGTPAEVSRRAVASGAAWAVPAVAVAAAAPAYSASPCQPDACPDMGFGGAINQNGWSFGSTGSYATGGNQRVGYYASYTPATGRGECDSITGGGAAGTLYNAIVAEADPTSGSPTPTITYEKTVCLAAGRTYNFAFNYAYYAPNRRAEYLDAQILNSAGTVVRSANRITAPASSANGRGTGILSFQPQATGCYTFRYYWSFASTPAYDSRCNRFANDIGVTAPTVTCQ